MRMGFLICTVLMGWGSLIARPVMQKQTQNAPPPERVPFCELAANAARYDGHIVLTEVVARNSIHAVVMYDPLCEDRPAKPDRNLSAQPTSFEPYTPGSTTELEKQYQDLMRQDGYARVVLIGRIDSSRGGYGVLYQPIAIAIRSFVSVYKIPEAERDAFHLPKMGPPPIPTGK
jgi:hypothetical protein